MYVLKTSDSGREARELKKKLKKRGKALGKKDERIRDLEEENARLRNELEDLQRLM